MIETELKFPIDKRKIKRIIRLLKRMGFNGGRRVYEKTVMYDNDRQIMQTTDGRIRLRVSDDSVELSYKKPLSRKNIKREVEYEVEVSNFQTTEKILAMMGFVPTTSYERYRTTFTKGEIKVTIDEYPFANFLEIEGKKEKIKNLALELGFLLRANLTDPCDTLFQKWRKEKGLDFKPHMRFEDYDK